MHIVHGLWVLIVLTEKVFQLVRFLFTKRAKRKDYPLEYYFLQLLEGGMFLGQFLQYNHEVVVCFN